METLRENINLRTANGQLKGPLGEIVMTCFAGCQGETMVGLMFQVT